MSLVDMLRDLGAVDPLDHRFAQLIGRRTGLVDERVLAAAALAGSVGARGHVCLRLGLAQDVLARELAARVTEGAEAITLPTLPEPEAWRAALLAAPEIVRSPGASHPTPLVLDGDALYLDRTWAHQQALVQAVRSRITLTAPVVPAPALDAIIDRLFDRSDPRMEQQRSAVRTALTRRLTVIAGGPGTGKTAVVVRLLAAFNHLEAEAGRPAPRVQLVAPTGKAAARMTESIRDRLEQWIPEELRKDIAPEASTIHRALKISPRTGRPRFDRDRPLNVDLLVVDEASMVDLPLMARLFAATPPGARLVLLGDPDQLVSVEKGAVLKELTAAALLKPCLVTLTESWRFAGGIARLARAINAGDADEALLALAEEPDLTQIEVPSGERVRGLTVTLKDLVVRGYQPAVTASDPPRALASLRAFRVLCAHRRGGRGVQGVGPLIEGWLRSEGLIPTVASPWYAGRAVLVARNDHQRRLYNGDVGMLLPDAATPDGPLRAWFESAEGPPRSFAPAGLPEHETVFATTVHKAQGSEYAEVVVVLPRDPSPLLTRELLYTAVTRASSKVLLLGSEQRIREAVSTPTQRMSGLGAAL
jgi:exodeoxyribonuclease V alpha subunit